jgi:hypothetical protein
MQQWWMIHVSSTEFWLDNSWLVGICNNL